MSQPQPPPDLPAPPPSKAARNSRRKALLIFVGLPLVLIALFSTRLLSRSRKVSEWNEALNNLKQIHTMLLAFETEYGKFPDASTIAAVTAKTGTTLPLGDASSNQLFRQMLASGSSKSEKPFWAKTAVSPKRGDDIFNIPSKALAPGECGFAYIPGLDSKSHRNTPLAFTPLIPGSKLFDPKPFSGTAFLLRVDGSAFPFYINSAGQVIDGSGMDIFDPRQPYWHGKAPDIKFPE